MLLVDGGARIEEKDRLRRRRTEAVAHVNAHGPGWARSNLPRTRQRTAHLTRGSTCRRAPAARCSVLARLHPRRCRKRRICRRPRQTCARASRATTLRRCATVCRLPQRRGRACAKAQLSTESRRSSTGSTGRGRGRGDRCMSGVREVGLHRGPNPLLYVAEVPFQFQAV